LLPTSTGAAGRSVRRLAATNRVGVARLASTSAVAVADFTASLWLVEVVPTNQRGFAPGVLGLALGMASMESAKAEERLWAIPRHSWPGRDRAEKET
jgi:hypothetical protein